MLLSEQLEKLQEEKDNNEELLKNKILKMKQKISENK